MALTRGRQPSWLAISGVLPSPSCQTPSLPDADPRSDCPVRCIERQESITSFEAAVRLLHCASLRVWMLALLAEGSDIEKQRRDGIEIFLTAVRPQPMKVMFEAGLAERIGLDRFCADIDQALAAARELDSTPASRND